MDNKKTKGEKALIISVIVIAVLAVLFALYQFIFNKDDKKTVNNKPAIKSRVSAKNDILEYDDIIDEINKSAKKVTLRKCDCTDVSDYDTWYNADCNSYELYLSDAGAIIDKIKSTEEAEEINTSIACAKYEFDIMDKNDDSIIYGYTGSDTDTILVGYEESGYGFRYQSDLSDFFDDLLINKKIIADYPGDITEKKPILYLYPKKDKTKVTVTFGNKKALKTTYPKYKDKWVVTANKNGDLTDENGNYYYALYWEEKQNKKVDFKSGFYVTKEDAITFLEEKLEYIGLSDRERNEFIMYWLPILETNKKSVVHFELTEDREKYNELQIDPKPDSLLRLSMHVKKVDKKPKNLEKQKLSNFKRKGFVAVEWGGVIHK